MPGNSTDSEHASVGEIVSWLLTGMSGWWSLNVIVAESPFFVAALPEGERLGNLLAVCTQVGNLAPIAFKAVSRCRGGHGQLVAVIAFSKFMALATLVACAFFWNVRVGENSAVLLLCAAIAGGVGCMSNVTYWAAASSRPASCTRAMSVGMTLGGLLATGFSSWQIAGRKRGEPRFEPFTFFAIAAIVQAAQVICFLLRSRRQSRAVSSPVDETEVSALSVILSGVEVGGNDDDEAPKPKPTVSGDAAAADATLLGGRQPLPTRAKMLLLGCFGIYAAVYTMPTLQPIIAGGYTDGTEAQQLYLWMMVWQNICDVTGRLATAYVNVARRSVLLFWAVMMVGTFFIAMVGAVESSMITKSLSYNTASVVIPALTGLFYFSRGLLVTSLYLRARNFPDKLTVERTSMNMGFCGQMGALGANAVAFVVVAATAGAA